jgi:hypothetical protein
MIQHNEEEEESGIKRDKIFDNEYESSEFELSNTKFSIEDSYREKSIDEKVDEEFVKKAVQSIVNSHPRFNRFIQKGPDGEYQKVNKSEINEIYSHVTSELSSHPKIEIFSVLTDVYDITPEKFYESLSNTFKTQLIIELRNRGYLKKRNFLF